MGSIYDIGEEFSSIGMQNFRQYNSESKIPLDKITLLIGENNSGKSSIIQLLYIMKEFSKKSLSEIESFRNEKLNQRPLTILLKILGCLFETKGMSGKSGSFEQFLSKYPGGYEKVSIKIASKAEDELTNFEKGYKRTIKVIHTLTPKLLGSEFTVALHIYCNEDSIGEGVICDLHIYKEGNNVDSVVPIWSFVSEPNDLQLYNQQVDLSYLADSFNKIFDDVKSLSILIKNSKTRGNPEEEVLKIIGEFKMRFGVELSSTEVLSIVRGEKQSVDSIHSFINIMLKELTLREIVQSDTIFYNLDALINIGSQFTQDSFKSNLVDVVSTEDGGRKMDHIIANILSLIAHSTPAFLPNTNMIFRNIHHDIDPPFVTPGFVYTQYSLFGQLEKEFSGSRNFEDVQKDMTTAEDPLQFCIDFSRSYWSGLFEILLSQMIVEPTDFDLFADFSAIWLYARYLYGEEENIDVAWYLLRGKKTEAFFVFCGMQLEETMSFLKTYENFHFVTLHRSNVNRTGDIGDGNFLSDFVKLTKNTVIQTLAVDATSNMSKWIQEFELGEKYQIERDIDSDSYKFFLGKKMGETSARILLADSGSGIIQLVVLIAAVTTLAQPTGQWNQDAGKGIYHPITIVLEEPEANLHPKLQSRLADFIHEMSEYYNIRFIIETHSEYIIRRLQYLVALKKIKDSNKISIINTRNYHPELGENASAGQLIKINPDGSLSKEFFPGFFDEADNLAIDLYTLLTKSRMN